MLDRVYQYYKRKNGGIGRPEYRLVNVIPGTFLLPIGLFIAGWGAQEKAFWLVPDIVGMVIIVYVGVIVLNVFLGRDTRSSGLVSSSRSKACRRTSSTLSRSTPHPVSLRLPKILPSLLTDPLFSHSSGSSVLFPLARRLRLPAVRTCHVQGSRLRQGRHDSRRSSDRHRHPSVSHLTSPRSAFSEVLNQCLLL